MGAHDSLDSILDAERAEAREWRFEEPEPAPTSAELDPPPCMCGHEYDDHWRGVPSTACDIDGCDCDDYRAHP